MRYALVNGHVIDGTENMQPQSGLAVVIEDGVIAQIAAESDPALHDIERIDLQGGYLCPGLINAHVHLVIAGKQPQNDKPVDYRKLVQTLRGIPPVRWYFLKSMEGNARNQLESGVTTIRCVGGILDWDGIIRDRVAAGRVVGPRIISCNMAVSVPGGHFAGSLATEATSPDEAAAHMRAAVESGADVVKLMITGGVMDATEEGEPGALRMPPELVRAACDEAHALGRKVAAHVESAEGVRVALEGGVDTIEHGSALDDKLVALFKQTGAAFINTMSPFIPYAVLPLDVARCGELGRKNGRIVAKSCTLGVRRALAEGIPVGLGTDTGCPFITHYDMWREVAYFARLAQVENARALYAATLGNARILGIDDITGSIEVGKRADFLVAKRNPLDDPAALRELSIVARDGVIIHNPKPRKDATVEAALDAADLTEFEQFLES